ncbi:hypothetical protein HK098_006106 [Nowakowskiella sp. JEL0407]|nr:hypothetical protein HK098_006106 [Nowakowskiella sp. JEL0407]
MQDVNLPADAVTPTHYARMGYVPLKKDSLAPINAVNVQITEEIEIKGGDSLQIIGKFDSKWFLGRNLTSNSGVGKIPIVCVSGPTKRFSDSSALSISSSHLSELSEAESYITEDEIISVPDEEIQSEYGVDNRSVSTLPPVTEEDEQKPIEETSVPKAESRYESANGKLDVGEVAKVESIVESPIPPVDVKSNQPNGVSGTTMESRALERSPLPPPPQKIPYPTEPAMSITPQPKLERDMKPLAPPNNDYDEYDRRGKPKKQSGGCC